MGLIPIYVYDDIPWIPYAQKFKEFGFVTSATKIGSLVDELQNITVEQFEKREKRILTLLESHFTPLGVMKQIERFMSGQNNDLRCQALPPTTRGAEG